jgi:hypothetical protein
MYTITHAHPIPRDVQLKIAQKFTEIHCARYKMPTSFVNINFVPVNPEETYYVGGKLIPSKTRIMGQVRPGESRSVEGFEQLVSELAAAFTEFAGGHGDEIAYVADIAIAIKENGVLIPRVRRTFNFESISETFRC